MDIKQLKDYLDSLAASLKNSERKLLNARLGSLISAFPFNEYEYILMFLLDKQVIQFNDYERLRDSYASSNKYLYLFDLAPRNFGGIWAESHIMDLDRRFVKPNRNIDPDYDGGYDLWINRVRVEVKACRAYHTLKREGLSTKALQYDSQDPFWMNFQQLKPEMCDVFIFIGVWTNQIIYWVLARNEVKNNRYYSPQHRGGIECQIGITDRNIADFDQYRVSPSEIAKKVIEKQKRE